MCISKKAAAFEFHPEVYLYPTPRTYGPISNSAVEKATWGEVLNVYIHIPFCRQICSFCGYLKMVDTTGGELISRYVNALTKEILSRREILAPRMIVSINIGGGTPSLLSAEQLGHIFDALRAANPAILNTALEVSIEATPESVEPELFSAFKAIGINRVSIGVQTTDANEIACAKRQNTLPITEQAIRVLRDIQIPQVVADLMIGIEGQTVQSFVESTKALIALRPDVVELYALGLRPHTGIATRIAKFGSERLMSNKDIYECYEIGRKFFLTAGYRQDCHNRYALGELSGYLQEDNVFGGSSVIGFGAGARSYAKDVHFRNIYHSRNHRGSILEYIERMESGMEVVVDGVVLTREEQMRQFLIYNIEHLDCAAFHSRFGTMPQRIFPEIFDDLRENGMTIQVGELVLLTPKGLLFRDLIAKEFFSSQVQTTEKFYRPL